MRRQVAIAIATVALVGGVAASLSVAQSSLAATSTAAASTVTDAQKTQRVFDDTNDVRAEAGTTPLVRNAALDKVAADWAYQQWKNGAMSHNPNYSTQIPGGWSHAGENVAAGYNSAQVTPAWTASPEHYRNLVGDYTDVGIGFYQAPDGSIYWTQEFAKYSTTQVPPKQTPSTAPVSTAPSTAPVAAPPNSTPVSTPQPKPSTPTPAAPQPTPTTPPVSTAPSAPPVRNAPSTPPATPATPAPAPQPSTSTSLGGLNLGQILNGLLGG